MGNSCVLEQGSASHPNKKVWITRFCVDGEPGDKCCIEATRDIEVMGGRRLSSFEHILLGVLCGCERLHYG